MTADFQGPPEGPTAKRRIDAPIAIEIVKNGFASVADEMAITHARVAYSVVVRDLLDFSTAVCDGEGRVLAQGLTLPLQLGAIPAFMRELRARVERFDRGDVFLVNHPWQGGVHLPDFFFASPVFLDGEDEPIGFAVIVSHMVDVGGPTPGGIAPSNPDIWHEGLIVPLVAVRRSGILNQELLTLIAANSRDPDQVLGDIRAVLAGLETGGREIRRLADRLGAAETRRYIELLLDHSERATRAAIAALPDGSAQAVDELDDDGAGGPSVRIECRVEKAGARLHFDFSGSAEQVPGGINCTESDVESVVAFVARAAIDEDLALNDGFLRCLSYQVPKGSVANALPPAAVSSRANTMYRLCDAAIAAVAQFLGDRLPATDGGPGTVYMSGRRENAPDWIMLDYVHAGWGGTSQHDGVAGVSHPISNAANMPAEILEREYPVRIRSYSLLADSAGVGEHPGAPAVLREYETLADHTLVTTRLERCVHPPRGQHGGGNGSLAGCEISRGAGPFEPGPGKGVFHLDAGDRLRIRLASAGGFGRPAAREKASIRRDVATGLTSPAMAESVYGLDGPRLGAMPR